MTNKEDIVNTEAEKMGVEKGQENEYKTTEGIVGKAEEFVNIAAKNAETIKEILIPVGQNPESDKISEENEELVGEAKNELEELKGEVETTEDFLSQFKEGKEVYDFLISGYDVDKLWVSTNEVERGKLVDMLIDFAIESGISRDEIIRLVASIEPSEHIGRSDTYKWLMAENKNNRTNIKDDQEIESKVQVNKESEEGIEKSENLSVDVIVEKINRGEKVSEKGGEKLEKEIEKVILAKGKGNDDWTEAESKMVVAYTIGVKNEWFKEGKINRIDIDFDYEIVEFNSLDREEKEEKIEERKKDASEKLIQQGIIESEKDVKEEFEKISKVLKKQLLEESKIYEDLYENRSSEDMFSVEGKEEIKRIIQSLRSAHQIELDLSRLEYLNLASDSSHLEFLIEKHHTEKDYTIRTLEEQLKAMDQVTNLLDKEERGELSEKEQGILSKIYKCISENPKMTILAIMALLATAGLLAYGAGYVASFAGEKILAEEIAKLSVTGLALNKGRMALVGVGLAVGIFTTVFNEEQRDSFMEWWTGKSVPACCRVGKKSSS